MQPVSSGIRLSTIALSVSEGIVYAVSYTHLDVYKRQIQGLVFGTATKEQKAATRASWNHWDIIHTAIILAITAAFYWYFW